MDADALVKVIAVLVTIFIAIVAMIFRKVSQNEERLNKHEVMFARISDLPEKLEKHERREFGMFKELREELKDLATSIHNVHLLVVDVKKNTNGTK